MLEAQMFSEVTEGTRMIPIFKKTGIILGITCILDLNRSKCRKALCTQNALHLHWITQLLIGEPISVFPLTPHSADKNSSRGSCIAARPDTRSSITPAGPGGTGKTPFSGSPD